MLRAVHHELLEPLRPFAQERRDPHVRGGLFGQTNLRRLGLTLELGARYDGERVHVVAAVVVVVALYVEAVVVEVGERLLGPEREQPDDGPVYVLAAEPLVAAERERAHDELAAVAPYLGERAVERAAAPVEDEHTLRVSRELAGLLPAEVVE